MLSQAAVERMGHDRIHLRGRPNGLELVNKEIENSKGNLWVVYKITDDCECHKLKWRRPRREILFKVDQEFHFRYIKFMS